MTQTTDLRLSVILPVRNGQAHLDQSLRCLAEQLSGDDELFVINDGSKDATSQVINSFSAQFNHLQVITNHQPIGPAAARNVGLKVAQGEFVAFLDHDDLWPAGKVKRHLNYLQSHPEISAVVGKTNYEFEEAMNERAFAFKNGSSALHHVHLGAATFRSAVFKSLGGFNESLRYSEDHELFLRIREQGHQIHFDPEVSLRYRVHGGNMSLDKSLHELGLFRILRDSIKRRQNQGNMKQLPKFGN